MRVLVTGGAGFIGSHVATLLQQRGHAVAVFDNLSTGRRENLPADLPFFEVDLRDRSTVARLFDEVRPEVVCHQAAQMSVSRSVREPSFDADVNIIGLLNVLENCVRTEVQRMVFASSGGVLYGDVSHPVSEEHPPCPVSPYGISKWVGERYLDFFAREHGLPSVALRYSNVYGPRQNPHGEAGVVAIFCQRMLRGEATTIHGDGHDVRDYVDVTDVAVANLLALEQPLSDRFTTLNIGTGRGINVNVIANQTHRLCKAELRRRGCQDSVPEPVHGPPRAGDLRSNLISARRATEVLGWQPRVSFEEGLPRTVEWFASRIM
jgi:UDP-glucose 4-epimerase